MSAQGPLPFLLRWATPVQVVLALGLDLQLSVLGGLAAALDLYTWWARTAR